MGYPFRIRLISHKYSRLKFIPLSPHSNYFLNSNINAGLGIFANLKRRLHNKYIHAILIDMSAFIFASTYQKEYIFAS